MIQSVLMGTAEAVDRVYAAGRRQRIAELTQLYPHVVHAHNLAEHLPALRDIQIVFSTWGQPVLSEQTLDAMPNFKALFYAAGTVQKFARPLLERGITVASAWRINGQMVAQFTLGQILLATKGYFHNQRDYRASGGDRANSFTGPGLFETPVAILGAGAIGRRVIELLQPFSVIPLVYDAFLSDQQVADLGAAKVSLDEAFDRALIITNHLASNPQTHGMITGEHFRRMIPQATFINTGRGATIVEDDLIDVLKQRPDLTALLDVTNPEPPQPDSPLFALPNVYVTSHIAGAINRETISMADAMIEQYLRWRDDLPVESSVCLEMLATMA